MTESRRCPACRAPWRGVATCPRCGADLAPLMRLVTRAWTLREAARAAFVAGEGATALDRAREACTLERTPRALRLLALALAAAGRSADARELLGRLDSSR